MWSAQELLRPSFWEWGSIVRMSPWLDHLRVFASAAVASARAPAAPVGRGWAAAPPTHIEWGVFFPPPPPPDFGFAIGNKSPPSHNRRHLPRRPPPRGARPHHLPPHPPRHRPRPPRLLPARGGA